MVTPSHLEPAAGASTPSGWMNKCIQLVAAYRAGDWAEADRLCFSFESTNRFRNVLDSYERRW